MSELSTDARRIVDHIARLTDERDAIDEMLEARKAELRLLLPIGTHTQDGRPVVTLTPNLRFSPSFAQNVLPPDMLALCMSHVISSDAAKKALPPLVYRACMAEVGMPRITLR